MDSEMNYKNIGRWFGVLDRQSQSYIMKVCARKDINYQEYILLLNLYDNEGISQEEMSQRMLVDKAVVARSIKSLESKDLVKRLRHDGDKRIKRLYLTDLGRENEEFIRSVLQDWIDFLSEGLSAQEVKVILEGLQYLSERASAVR